jgi:hypothetical protein
MNIRPLLLATIIASSSAPALAQTACEISGQLQGPAAFDPGQVEFVPVPSPDGLSFQTISRVVGLQPLVFETLDVSLDDRYAVTMCEAMRVYSVDSRLRDLLLQLRFNDTVKATMMLAAGGKQRLVLSGLEKVSGAPTYFHERAGDSVCPNRTGTLVAYTRPSGETIIMHNDGAISYQDAHFNEFNRQRLDPGALTHLLQSFRSTGFDGLPDQMPPIDDARSQTAITLVCGRHQHVIVAGREMALASVLRNLDEAKAKALSETYYLLTYQRRHEVTFLDWPFPQLPLEKMEALREASMRECEAARNEKRRPGGVYIVMEQDAPAWFLMKLPLARFDYPEGPREDPHRYVYCKAGARIFRVEKDPGAGEPGEHCSSWDCLGLTEALEPTAALARAEAAAKKAPSCCFSTSVNGSERGPDNAAYERLCSPLMGVRGGVRWPVGTAVELSKVPAAGQRIDEQEFAKHPDLYRELLAAGNCGKDVGIDFLDGSTLYQTVRLVRLEGAK